ncbi:uncharacterized protein EI90DRAFT_3041261 [Cantharellus anzutake]|uniref:uncharacterized protein n=1 Tax=Cantharellus anzutake TaxID=1750568 RepID=UPI0019053DD3|nr:uncharacterized protein EI90DRAFT_3041261 [Cantharellus anzutake]KAF8337996.1 hypothetical protein EI90DRAFT_3041261 [Cantharellus anzutake]
MTPTLIALFVSATPRLLQFQLLHTLLRLLRLSTSTMAYPLSPVWSLAPVPRSGSSQQAPKHTFFPRSLVLLACTLSKRSGRPQLVPP